MHKKNRATHCGYIAIVGRPNVGKSTLLNHLLGTKLSITSRKPQTTRHRILGIKTTDTTQFIFVDTPGIHSDEQKKLNRHMNRAALHAMHGVDVIFFVVEALQWTQQENWILEKLKKFTTASASNLEAKTEPPVFFVINKIDRVKPKEKLLTYINEMKDKFPFTKIIPISALKSEQLDILCEEATPFLPEHEYEFEAETITDKDDAFRISEIIREKLMRQLGQELPYALTVTVEKLERTEKLYKIAAVIWVERDGQKPIVIGKQGAGLKKVGQEAREDLEVLFKQKVFLQLWVKIQPNWSDDQKWLAKLGYDR